MAFSKETNILMHYFQNNAINQFILNWSLTILHLDLQKGKKETIFGYLKIYLIVKY